MKIVVDSGGYRQRQKKYLTVWPSAWPKRQANRKTVVIEAPECP